ncbi:MAG: translation initiation factor [Candidatus Latescibacteria bacterium]|jgi:translation initiation factor 1|nr:translation initiation factor [Candidatus Latescibacterota bacterium]MBT4137559.1 translation initiation factor [Candidatus Latescibacterota bacterium]MBT5829053.1 translation initiation factor [Candidatus Latescibacterota bacterium]
MSKRTNGQGWSLNTSDTQQVTQQTEIKPPEKQRAVFAVEKRKKGKKVTLIKNLALSDADLKDLARTLKTACGTGGTARDGEIELQGDCRDRARIWFEKNGYGLK